MAPRHVEANSLSDITQLAGNPPKYPRNPTEQARQPLTLYIARVPGSQDIILTTLKPQLKNVTASDVASSLYYLHLNTEDDARFLDEIEQSPTKSMEKPLPRKPLPDTTRSSLEVYPPLGPASTHPGSLPEPLNNCSGVTGTGAPQKASLAPKQPIPRKPLGPRPLETESVIGRKPLPLLSVENKTLGAIQGQPSGERASMDSIGSYRSHEISFGSTKAIEENPEVFSINLIRRDPSSGAQWNVGTISGHPSPDVDQNRRAKSTPHSKRVYFDMSIHLTNPGYSYFRNSKPIGSLESGLATLALGQPPSLENDTPQPHRHPSYGFDRQLRMEGTSFWNRASTQHKRAVSDLSSIQKRARGRSSTLDTPEEPLDIYTSEGDLTTSHSKGYLFLSPWDGRCKFSTSSSGRTLRCKHTLPLPVSASNTTDSLPSPQRSEVVSELRFNLPGSTLFASSKETAKKVSVEGSRFSMQKFEKIKSRLATEKEKMDPNSPILPPRPQPNSYNSRYPSDDDDGPPLPPRPYHTSFVTDSSDDGEAHGRPFSDRTHLHDDDEDRLDLSLGQEKAGGGNRGKRAKLGKVIVYDEGLKMLDLVIAANMGVWWSVWKGDV